LHRNYLLKHVIKGRIEERLGGPKETRGYSRLKEEELDDTL
jgi:hypothetical protein